MAVPNFSRSALNGRNNMKFIRPDIIDDLWGRSMYSPDIPDLSMYDNHLVFIFDGLKQEINPTHNLMFLRDSKFLGKAYTVRKEFIMKQQGYPIVQVKKQANQKRSVMGEVYAVSTNILMRLDALYDNTNRTLRCKEYVELTEQNSPTKTPQHPIVQAYMYIADDHYWDKAAATWMPGNAAFRQDGWFWEFKDVRGVMAH
jgi:gamma-glutamylcyclotransferase (GGCT)/AIG2-like uncharacterized protein YtfP